MSILALFTTLALTAQQSPTLLPEAPEGWRFERLDFPLGFAPQIDYEGFEELWFAPGMFDAASDSYFSYVLAIRLEEDVRVDRAWVLSFLERYYRGLSAAVSEGSGFEIDEQAFLFEVERTEMGFSAEVGMVDPFVTGEALALQFDLSVQPGPRRTDLFGVVSPAPRDASPWDEMRAMREAWRAKQPVAVLLNHLYFVPDAETYRAIAASGFLTETFGVNEERTTVRQDLSYTGFYFYGENTYFEFLAPEASELFAAGSTGLAFGIERRGGTQQLSTDLNEAGLSAWAGPITRDFEQAQLPWFEMMGIQNPHEGSTLSLFSLEYDPGFLDLWHSGQPPARGGISRAAVLERYAHSLEQTELREQGLFRDVTRVDLALDEAERELFFTACRLFGYEIESSRSGGWTCDGPQVTFAVEAAEGPGGVTGFEVELRRPVERDPLELGQLRVRFDDRVATFEFAR